MHEATTVGRPRIRKRLPALAVPVGGLLRSPVWAALPLTALAAWFRFRSLSASPPSPFYDAAVRSMGQSWHNFFYGAFDPSAQLAVDKPPVDLWLQVASVKLFGFSVTSLILPAALFGTLAVPLLYDAVRRVFGMVSGICAGVALAVLPVSVVASRSDALDSVMMALSVLALWLCVRAVQSGRARWLYLAAFVVGLDFNVKLFEALVPLPGLLAIYVLGARLPVRRRLGHVACAGAVFVATALAWAAAVSLSPGRHPYPIGSTNGSVWNVIFVFNGLHRIFTTNHSPAPGLLNPVYGGRIGSELVPAFVFGLLALLVVAVAIRRSLERAALAVSAGLGIWLVTGFVLFQRMHGLRARYLEAFTPAVAAVLGIGVGVLSMRTARGRLPGAAGLAAGLAASPLLLSRLTSASQAQPPGLAIAAAVAGATLALAVALVPRIAPPARMLRVASLAAVPLAALALASLLAAPAAYSARLVHAHASDAGGGKPTGPAVLAAFLRFLPAHRGGTRFEYGAVNPHKASGLIVHDGQPALILTTYHGHQVVSPKRVKKLVLAGEVRYFVMDNRCLRPRHGCPPAVRWVVEHGRSVNREAGVPRPGVLYEVTRAGATAGGRTTTAHSPRRSARSGRGRAGSRQARRGRHGRS
ncbi:MAG TPA: glycosyltransferase family 39 protein [Thermoleophilaceae bacterium]|nr:glycosyltransferase family 39 protein [Thermoleophilaceae bacterium]